MNDVDMQAVNALRYALKHPLTSHGAETSGGKGAMHFTRLTELQKARMRPRRPYKPPNKRHPKGGKRRAGDRGPCEGVYTLDWHVSRHGYGIDSRHKRRRD